MRARGAITTFSGDTRIVTLVVTLSHTDTVLSHSNRTGYCLECQTIKIL